MNTNREPINRWASAIIEKDKEIARLKDQLNHANHDIEQLQKNGLKLREEIRELKERNATWL